VAIARKGIAPALEAEANRIIKESLVGVRSRTAKSDILTEDKEKYRRSKEMYVDSGTPDPSVRSGNFHRRLNPARPELNSREGIARARSITGSLQAFTDEYGFAVES
jgi:hypothetical protein